MSLKRKLVCPYCKAKQEYKAEKYFVRGSTFSFNIQCDDCDERFNAHIQDDNTVETYSNLTVRPVSQ